MKKFFGSKPKRPQSSKDTEGAIEGPHFPTPVHVQHATYTRTAINTPGLYPNTHFRDNIHPSPSDDQPWEVVSNKKVAAHARVLAPSQASIFLPSPSPHNFVSDKPPSGSNLESSQLLWRKAPPGNSPAALGILRALDVDKEATEKQEKRGFWGALTKDGPSLSERDQKDDEELTRMIGYLTATASEDWTLILEVCERASSNEANAKEAVRALKREFKYGGPVPQLSAARLWAIMSRHCSSIFIAEASSRKFIATIEELVTSSKTPPVVRERLLDVIAATAFNCPKDSAFRILWRRVKPAEKPEEGVPFDLDDEMTNPPTNSRRSQIDTSPRPVTQPIPALSNTLDVMPDTPRKRPSPARERIIPLEEDIRRLFQECRVGMGNAALLSDVLAVCKPEKLKTDPMIKEFYAKCCASQELIDAQIPWATAGAERSRSQSLASQALRSGNGPHAVDEEQTIEERLLAELLKANEELQLVLKQYSDIERVVVERWTVDLSGKVTRMERQYSQYQDSTGWSSSDQDINETPSSTRSASPSIRSETPPRNSDTHDSRPQTSLDIQGQLLAPPPAAPRGPRSPPGDRKYADQPQFDRQHVPISQPPQPPPLPHVNSYTLSSTITSPFSGEDPLKDPAEFVRIAEQSVLLNEFDLTSQHPQAQQIAAQESPKNCDLQQHSPTSTSPTSAASSSCPSDPALYRIFLAHILNIPSEDTIDFTAYVDRGALIATGGFGNVYRGQWKNLRELSSQVQESDLPDLVVKVINLPTLDSEKRKEKRLKRIKRELELWRKLRHDNILPLVGFACINSDSNMPAFVSPWMKDGSVMNFLEKNPTFPALGFLRDIIRGLHYLHMFDPEIVHGDMKASNVLVNHCRHAYLCDFGLSRFSVDNTLWNTTATRATGTMRWMAPELLDGEESVSTRASDIYGYGMTCYEILSGETPFQSIRSEFSFMKRVMNGGRPERIASCHDEMWSLITLCWAQDAQDRPSTEEVLMHCLNIPNS